MYATYKPRNSNGLFLTSSEITKYHRPYRALLCSLVFHVTFVLILHAVYSMPTVQLREPVRMIEESPEQEIAFLPQFSRGGSSSGHQGGNQGGGSHGGSLEGKGSPSKRDPGNSPRPMLRSRYGISYRGPQVIVSHPIKPDNNIQTILRPDKSKAPIIRADVKLPNIVMLPLVANTPRPRPAPPVTAPPVETVKQTPPTEVPAQPSDINVPAPPATETIAKLSLPRLDTMPDPVKPVQKEVTQPIPAPAPPVPPAPTMPAMSAPKKQLIVLNAVAVSGPLTQIPEGERHGEFVVTPAAPADGAGSSVEKATAPTSGSPVGLGGSGDALKKGGNANASGSGTGAGTLGNTPGAGGTGTGQSGTGAGSAGAGSGAKGTGGTGGAGSGSGPGAGAGAGTGTGAGAGSGPGSGAGTGGGTGSGSGPGNGTGSGTGSRTGSGAGNGGSGQNSGGDDLLIIGGSNSGRTPRPERPKKPETSFDLTVVGSGASGGIGDFGVFRDETVYTVYISMDTVEVPGPDWTMQYSLLHKPAAVVDPTGKTPTEVDWSGIVVAPVPQVKKSVSWPAALMPRFGGRKVIVKGVVDVMGRFVKGFVVQSPTPALTTAVLETLAHWEFQPAKWGGHAVEVKVLLSVPVAP